MKTYEKPKLMVLSFTTNDALCTSCTVATRFNSAVSSVIEAQYPGLVDADGFFTPAEAESVGFFGNPDECDNSYGGYCKYIPDGNSLFTS